MRKLIAVLCVLSILVASCIIIITPAWASEGSWTTKTRMGLTKTGFGVGVVDGKIYVIGGHPYGGESHEVTIDDNSEYDPATDRWASKSSMPGPLAWFGTAVYQNEIYVIGGAWFLMGTEVSDVRVYNPATDTWTSRASMPTARATAQANIVDGKIYVIGGEKNGEVINVNEVYDPVTDTWATRTPIPTPVSGYASAVVDGKIYVISGLTPVANSTSTSLVSLNQIYDPKTDTWSLGEPLPETQNAISAGATTGVMASKRICVIGDGLNQIYDPANDSWTVGAPIPNSANRMKNFADVVVAVVDDQLYAMGGVYAEGDSRYSVNEQYTPTGYGTVPPEISVASPENKTYTASNVSLAFTMNKPASWMGYSLDGKEEVTITGNTTLTELANGSHSLTVYANDTDGNTGVSDTIYFSVAKETETEPEPSPAIWVATAIAIAAVTGVVSLAAYYVRRKRATQTVQ